MPFLAVLWDESQIWGLLAVRAAREFGIPCRLISGAEVADGALQKEPPAMLLVPGGSARRKAQALGKRGLEAIREYVRQGGRYLGFCGGAGLALSHEHGLGLCPWTRDAFDDRMQHFMSGHLTATCSSADHFLTTEEKEPLLLPVWWPGRFKAEPNDAVTVLAAFDAPAHDFWLADLPAASLPSDIFSAWEDLYGFSPTPYFLTGRPCIVGGEFGGGSYILSYSHLETPDSPDANRLLRRIFTEAGLSPAGATLAPWEPDSLPQQNEDPLLSDLCAKTAGLVALGMEHGLLFHRNSWLFGWRTGIPGANLNNLRAAARTAASLPFTSEAERLLHASREGMQSALQVFAKGCEQYLLTERLAQTLAKSLPDAVPPALLKDRRDALFGPPMQAGGAYRELIEPLDRLLFLLLRSNEA